MESTQDLGLEQMVHEPTHNGNVLNLALTSAPDLIPKVDIVPGLSGTQHCVL